MKTNDLKNTKAITLIALIVTLIVLLILAGVSIAVLTGENGIINRTTSAKKTTEEAEAQEKLQLELEALKIDYYKSGQNGTFAEYLQSREADLKTALGDNTLKVENGKITYGGYDYTVDGQGNITGKSLAAVPVELTTQTTEKYSEWTILNNMPTNGGFDGKVNMPKLGSELKAVVLTSDLPNTVQNNKVSQDDVIWYDYIAQTGTTENGGTSKWGNAVTLDSNGEIDGFYVWVPRFAYKITSGYHGIGLTYNNNVTTESGTIEVKFLKGATNEFADGSTDTIVADPTQLHYDGGVQREWLVHPAFLSDANIGGGFGTKLGADDGIPGIWIAKFEMSSFIDGGNTATRNINGIAGNQSIKICSLPSIDPATSINIGEMYQLSLAMNTNAKSHLLKNSEWGAVAYLAHSKYGRNGTEVSSEGGVYKTGGSNSATAYLSNGTQSTTGNAYGIYDMAGVSWEYVASYVNTVDNNLATYGGDMTSTNIGTSSEYKTVYTPGTSQGQQNNYNMAEGMKGDAVYETSLGSGDNGDGQSSWYSDGSLFPAVLAFSSSNSFFARGETSECGTKSGLFYFGKWSGSGTGSSSFRVSLVL